MVTFKELVDKYLAWCINHREPRTTEWYSNYLHNFLLFLKDNSSIPPMDLRPYHIVEWVDSHPTWGDNYRRGAIVSVQRVFNWSVEMGFLDTPPFKKVVKPPAVRRETYTTPEDFEKVLSMIAPDDPFRCFLIFMWRTGARPQEARHIEKRHVELEMERIVFPVKESKGKRKKRIIYMQGDALEIITRLVNQYPEGKLFRNKRGKAWTKYSVCNRHYRLAKKLGKRFIAYGNRHGFITRKLLEGKDHLVLAELAGHADGTMISRVYSHISDNPAHLKKALDD